MDPALIDAGDETFATRFPSPRAMRHRRDQLGKDLLDLLLSRWGTLRTEDPVPAADLQRADVSFVPTAPLPEFLGLLARLAMNPCLFELFSGAPSREDFYGCMRKFLQWRHAMLKRVRAAEVMCWMLCAARPTLALAALGFARDARYPAGVYTVGWSFGVVILDELPRTQDTLMLRLLGRDRTRDLALDALTTASLDPAVLDEIVGLFVDYSALSPPEDDPMAVDLSRYYAWKEQQRAEGRLEGRLEGRAEALRRAITGLCQALGVPLDPARESSLTNSDPESLQRLFDALVRERAWPSWPTPVEPLR